MEGAEELNVTLIRCIFVLLGLSTYLPWFAFINAVEYFETRFCFSSDNWIRNDFEAVFGFVSTSICVLTVFVKLMITSFWNKSMNNVSDVTLDDGLLENENVNENEIPLLSDIRCSSNLIDDNGIGLEDENEEGKYKYNSKRQVLTCFSISFLVLIFHAILVFVTNPLLTSNLFFIISILSMSIFCVCSTVSNLKLVVESAIYPQSMGITPYNVGISLGGFLMSLINLTTEILDSRESDIYKNYHCNTADDNSVLHDINLQKKYSSLSSCSTYETDYNTFAYFTIPCFVILVTMFGFRYLQNSSLRCYYEKKHYATKIKSLKDENSFTIPQNDDEDNNDDTDTNNSPLDSSPSSCDTSSTNIQTIYSLTKEYNFINLFFSVLVIVSCTSTLFPGVIATIHSIQQCQHSSRLYNDLFTPILFLIYNIFDLFGKIIAPFIYTNTNTFSKQMLLISFFRALMLFFFYAFPPFNDAVTFLLLSITAFSNGCICNLCFLHALERTPLGKENDVSTMMNLGLYIGFFIGGVSSLFYLQLLHTY